MAAGDAEKKDKEKRRRPGLRIEVKGPGGFLVLGGAVILAGFGAAWAANRAPAKDRRKKGIDKKEDSNKGERGQRNDGEEKTRSGIPSPLLLSSPEIVDLRHEKLSTEVKRMGIQENKFIYEIKQNPKICMVTEENHLEANIIGDGVKDFSLDGDESNMLEYSKEPIAEGLRSIDVQGAVEESEGGEEVEEKSPSVEYDKKDSSLDGDESSKPEFSKEPIAEGLRSVEVKGAVEESEGGEKIEEEALSVESDMKDFSLKGDESNIPEYSKKPVAEGSRSVDVKGTVEESECGEKIKEEAPSLEYDMKDSSLDGDESNMPEFSKEPIVERSRLVDVKGLEEESEGGEKTVAAAAVPSVEYDMKDSSLDDDESNMLEYSKEPIAEGLRSADVKRTLEESEGGKEIEEEAPLVESNKKDFLLDSDKSNMPKFSKEPTAEGLRSVDVQGAVEENDSSEDIEERAPSVKSDTKDFSLDGDVSNMPYSKKPIAEGLRSIDVQGAVEESKGGEELEDALSAESDKKDFSLDGDELNMPEYLKEPIVEGTRSIEVQAAVEESKGGEEIEEEEEAPLVQSDMKEFSLDGDECSVSAYSQEPIIEGFRSIDVNGVVEESEGGEKIETAAAPSVEYDMKDSSLDGDESNILEYSKEPIAKGFRSADVKRAVEESEGGKEIEEEALSVECDKKDFLLDNDESNILKFSKEPTAEGLRSVDVQGAVEENDGSEDIEQAAPSVESDTKDFSLDGDVSNMPEYSKKLIAEGLRSVDVKGTVEESEGGEKIEEALLVEYDMKDSLDGDESNKPEFSKELIAERLRVVDVKGVVAENEGGEKIEAAKAPSVEYDIKDSSLHGDESNMLEYSKEPIAEGWRSADVKRAIEESEGGKEIEEEAPLVESDKKHFLLDSDESNMPEFPKEPLVEGLRSVDIQGAVEENDGSEDIEEQAPLVESVTKDFSLDGDVSNMPEYSKEPIAEGSRSIDVQGAVEESKGGEEFEEALSAESDKKDFQLDGDELNMPEYLKEPIVEGSRSIDVQGAVEESKCGERKEEEEEEAPLVQSDMKEFSLDGDECNMSAYSQEPIIEELRSIDVNGAVEESQGGEEIEEEAPSVESEEEGIESSIKEDESDGTAASSVESNTNVFWPAEMLEKEESLPPPESIKMKNNSVIHEEIKQIVDAAREAEIVEEYEEKGPILDEREAIAAGNMKTIRLTTTMIMGKEMDITSISHSKVFLLMLILALSIGLLSFTHHHHLSALYKQFCQLIFPVKNDTL